MTIGGGYLEKRGGCHEYCGGYLEYHRDTQYHRGYPDACGGYLEYHGRCSVSWRDIIKICGGYLEYRGGYHEYHRGYLEYYGDIQYHEGIMMHVAAYHQYRGGVLNTPHGTHDIPPHAS